MAESVPHDTVLLRYTGKSIAPTLRFGKFYLLCFVEFCILQGTACAEQGALFVTLYVWNLYEGVGVETCRHLF